MVITAWSYVTWMAQRLKRLGFRAIADKAAQLPGLLREIEGHGATGELKLPEIIQRPVDARRCRCPQT